MHGNTRVTWPTTPMLVDHRLARLACRRRAPLSTNELLRERIAPGVEHLDGDRGAGDSAAAASSSALAAARSPRASCAIALRGRRLRDELAASARAFSSAAARLRARSSRRRTRAPRRAAARRAAADRARRRRPGACLRDSGSACRRTAARARAGRRTRAARAATGRGGRRRRLDRNVAHDGSATLSRSACDATASVTQSTPASLSPIGEDGRRACPCSRAPCRSRARRRSADRRRRSPAGRFLPSAGGRGRAAARRRR